MPWRCPSCGNRITHHEADTLPTPDVRYRCPICRLDLEFRPSVGKFVIVRDEDDHPRKT